MCGRHCRFSDEQCIAEAFALDNLPPDFILPDWDYNVAPHIFQPVISGLIVLIRTRSDAAQFLDAMGPVIASLDPNLVAITPSTLDQMLHHTHPSSSPG
jgi:hypothetical protein